MCEPTEICFSCPSRLRQFELVVEKRSLFVNAHYLAELSPYFELLCFGDAFREAREGRAELEDESYDEVVELLQFICPGSTYTYTKQITDGNFPVLAHFSHTMQFPHLRLQLEAFIEKEFASDSYIAEEENMLEMIVEASEALFSAQHMDILYRKFAKLGIERITELTKKLPDEYAAAIIREAQRFVAVFPSQRGYRSAYDYNHFNQRIFF